MIGSWQGMVIGVSVAAPVGPMAIMCLRRSVLFGRSVGLATGLGVASAHALYSAVALIGLQGVSTMLERHGSVVRVVSATMLAILGVRIACAAPSLRRTEKRQLTTRAAYASAVVLCLANPLTVASLAGLFAALDQAEGGGLQALTLVLGVFAGSSLWWLFVTGLATAFARALTTGRIRWFNRIAGGSLIAMGSCLVIA